MQAPPAAVRDRTSPGVAPWTLAPLLFVSGFCALVYQVAWQREFRLIFGASTAASACVVAVFNIALFVWATRDYWREVVAARARAE